MFKHEEKTCQRCKMLFECKAGNICQCQCYGINLTELQRSLIEKQYADCLCRNCLIELAKNNVAATFMKIKVNEI